MKISAYMSRLIQEVFVSNIDWNLICKLPPNCLFKKPFPF